MKSPARCLGLAAVAAFILVWNPVLAQKSGGVLKIEHMDNPPSASIHEEATFSVVMPFMALFNNLVMFDQHVARNSLESVVPELATSWTWSGDGKGLSFKLRQGVKWHDGKPFTAKDVACTFDLLIDPDKLRRNPRAAWWGNLEKVTVESDVDVTIHLKRRQEEVQRELKRPGLAADKERLKQLLAELERVSKALRDPGQAGSSAQIAV